MVTYKQSEDFDAAKTQECGDVGAVEIEAGREASSEVMVAARAFPPPLPARKRNNSSGVYESLGELDRELGSTPLTVEEIDALPGLVDREANRKASAIACLSLLRIDTLHIVIGELVSKLEDEHAVALLLERLRSFPIDEVRRVAKESMQLLGNRYYATLEIENAARSDRREAEVAIIEAVGTLGSLAVGAD